MMTGNDKDMSASITPKKATAYTRYTSMTMASSTASTKEERPQSCSGCSWCKWYEENNEEARFTTWSGTYTSKEACFELNKFLKAVGSSPNGLVERKLWDIAEIRLGLPEWYLISEAISCRRRHEEKIQMQRRTLFLQQQQQSSPLGSALFNTFPIQLLKHIASYLAKPSQALFAVSLGNFDMSSITAMSTTATNRIGGHKRNSDGSLREEISTAYLADMPAESLRHIVSFIPGFSQALFGLAVAAANDELLNKNSFAIVDDQCWEDLDFGEIEQELAMRLSDDDIKAVLWCIDAANKVKRLSLAHCVNVTGTCLEPLRGSAVIEQIDMSLVARNDSPTLLELWHPPQQIYFLVAPLDPPLSCEVVLPILDSIIGLKQCSLQHLRFPKSWRGHCQTTMKFREDIEREHRKYFDRGDTFKPDPAFVSFLSRYNQVLMSRGTISCVNCSRGLPRSGYELVGSIFSDDDATNLLTFGNQNHTCSQCMKHYCYRCDGRQDRQYGFCEFSLERCDICEKDQCVECSGTYHCEGCRNYYCMSCSEGTTCSDSGCDNKICSDCDLRQCDKCKIEGFCPDCATTCDSCHDIICQHCDDTPRVECSNCGSSHHDSNGTYSWCHACVSRNFKTCEQCKEAFCCDFDNDGCNVRDCHSCKKVLCVDCSVICDVCENSVCDECSNFTTCSNDVCDNRMCKNCASVKTCQQCKGAFCCGVEVSQCQTCTQTFCQDCVTLSHCSNLVQGPLGRNCRCNGHHCVDCPDESFVEVARTCSELNKNPCGNCRSMAYTWNRCARCSRTSCKTWQSEKKKLLDDLNESLPKGNSHSYEAMFTVALEKHKMDTVKLLKESAARGERSVSVTAIGEARTENVAVMRRANALMSKFMGRLYRTEPQITAELSRAESDAVQVYIADAETKRP